jgi:hypothetical protein
MILNREGARNTKVNEEKRKMKEERKEKSSRSSSLRGEMVL